MLCCSKCGKLLDDKEGSVVASISRSFMGDEDTESYFFCMNCGVYTLEIYHDRFLDESSVFVRGPLSKDEGDAKVELIRRCLEPWDKKCRCPAHKEYFHGQLD